MSETASETVSGLPVLAISGVHSCARERVGERLYVRVSPSPPVLVSSPNGVDQNTRLINSKENNSMRDSNSGVCFTDGEPNEDVPYCTHDVTCVSREMLCHLVRYKGISISVR